MEEINKNEYVNVGDIIKISVVYDGKEVEEKTVKVVDHNTNNAGKIQEMSIFSPLGKAIYGQKIGKGIVTNINDKKIYIIVKEKELDNNITSGRRKLTAQLQK